MNKGILIILDGYGEGKPYEYNAVVNAKTPTLDKIKSGGYSLLKTSGEAVGLFEGDMGGSEVGHTTIGAGRIVPSTALKINQDVESGEFKYNKKICMSLNKLEKNKSNLHLIGMMSDKNIHSNINHCLALIDMAKGKAENIFIHIITDGRDTGPYESVKYLKILKNHIKNIKNCHFLSVSGRFYAMDRENCMERTKQALNAMFFKDNLIKENQIDNYILNQHKREVNDQYIMPAHVDISEYKGIGNKECVIVFNFREDRLRQLVKECEKFGCEMLTMADVGGVKAKPIYTSEAVKNTLSEQLSNCGLSQVKIAETTKYAHVTFFFNGGKEEPFKNEDRILIPSIEINDYALTPKMRAKEITKSVVASIKKGYDAIIVNYSNPDMVGHTGNYEATVTALECVDKCIQKVEKFAKKYGYFMLVTADHGNSEEMKNDKGEQVLSHTLNDVFCSVVNKDVKLKKTGGLKDVAPTFFDLMGISPNKAFKGESLIVSDIDK